MKPRTAIKRSAKSLLQCVVKERETTFVSAEGIFERDLGRYSLWPDSRQSDRELSYWVPGSTADHATDPETPRLAVWNGQPTVEFSDIAWVRLDLI